MGETFGLQVEFQSPYIMNNPNLGIRINTPSGNTVLGIASYMQNEERIASKCKSGVFRVLFDKPNLNQGMYYVTLTLGDNQVTCDRKAEAISFEVTPVDVFGTGKIPSPDQSNIFTEGRWIMIKPEEVNWA